MSVQRSTAICATRRPAEIRRMFSGHDYQEEAMTAHLDQKPIPAMDDVYRFMVSNPQTSCEMIIETLKLDADPEVSVSRFRELWQLGGGRIDGKNGRAWVEIDLLGQALSRVINAVRTLVDRPVNTTEVSGRSTPDVEAEAKHG